jgi:hypothetical protein
MQGEIMIIIICIKVPSYISLQHQEEKKRKQDLVKKLRFTLLTNNAFLCRRANTFKS